MKPVLLLIPGMLNDARVWSGVADRLGADADIRIANVQSQDSIAAMARDAWQLLADVPPEVPLVLCGFSMGGYVAIEMIATGDRFPGAIGLLDTSCRPETAEGAAMREKTIAAIGRDFPKVVDGILQFGTHAASRANADLMHPMRQMMLDVGAQTAIRQNQAIAARSDHRERLRTLDIPVLVMCGRDDRITPPALSEEIAATVPGARLEWVELAGHMAPLEQPDMVAGLIKTLLASLPAPQTKETTC